MEQLSGQWVIVSDLEDIEGMKTNFYYVGILVLVLFLVCIVVESIYR